MLGVLERTRRALVAPQLFSRFAPAYEWLTTHQAQRTSLDELSHRVPLEASILDVACGPGVVLAHLLAAEPRRHGLGIDIARGALLRASDRVSVVRGSADALPFADGTFDCVISCGAVYLMRRPQRALQEMRRVSRDRVIVLEATPEMNVRRLASPREPLSPKARLDYSIWSLAMHASERYTPARLKAALSKAGLHDVQVEPICRGMIMLGHGGVREEGP